MLQEAKATKIILCKFITTQQLHFTKLFTRKYVQLGMPVQFAFLDFQAGYSEATFHIPVKVNRLKFRFMESLCHTAVLK